MVSILQFSCLKTNCQNFYLSQSDLTHLSSAATFCSSPPTPPRPQTRRKVFIGGGVDGNLHLTSSAVNWVTSAKAFDPR